MSYLVLARKYRPQKFKDIIGQEHITTALANSIIRNRVPHALLFTGPRGTGKTTSARIYARALNCIGRPIPTEVEGLTSAQAADLIEPCGTCVQCEEIAKSISMSVREIDGASNNSVEDVRAIIDNLYMTTPGGAKFKIFLIDEVHMLSTSAFNALLKSLEEPPPDTVFIFATTEPHKIPDTVLSRCQRHDVRSISSLKIAELLSEICKAENVSISEEALRFVSRRAKGGMRDGLSMLDRLISAADGEISLELAEKVFGARGAEFYGRLCRAIFTGDSGEALGLVDNAFSGAIDIRSFLSDLILFWRDLLIVSTAADRNPEMVLQATDLTSGEMKAFSALAANSDPINIIRMFEILEQAVRTALQSQFPRFVIEAAVVKLAQMPSLLSISEMLGKLQSGKVPVASSRSLPLERTTPVAPKQIAVREPVAKQAPVAKVAEVTKTEIPSVDKWTSFLTYLNNSGGEVVLAAFLRRVVATELSLGHLGIKGTKHDIEALNEPSALSPLKALLGRFFGGSNWVVNFTVGEVEEISKSSVAGQEQIKKKERVATLEAQGKESPEVKEILSAFTGSFIEKVAVRKI